MRLIIKIMIGVIVMLVIAVGAAGLVGVGIPENHTVSRTVHLNQPAETVWATIIDFEASAAWRTDLAKIERLPDRNGHPVWQEVAKDGMKIPLEVTEAAPPRHLVLTIADDKLPFAGAWTTEIVPAGSGSTVTITENGTVKNPLFRTMMKMMGATATIDGYLMLLGKKFGETVTPATAT